MFDPRRLRRGTAAHPFEACSGTSRDALLEVSWLVFSEGGLGGLSWNILARSGHSRLVLEDLGMLLDVLHSAPGRPPWLLRSMEIYCAKVLFLRSRRVPEGLKSIPRGLLDRLGLMQATWSVLGCNFGHRFGPPFGAQTGPEPFPTSFFRLLSLPRALQEAL